MIAADVGATMACDEEGCTARLGVALVLTLTGGFAVKPPEGHGWQVRGLAQANLFDCRCPLHKQVLERVPRIVGAH